MNYPNFKDVKTFKNAFIQNVENKYAIEFADSTSYQQYVVLGKCLECILLRIGMKRLKKLRILKHVKYITFPWNF